MFDGDVIFVFPPIDRGVLDAYGRAIHGIDKIYNGHVWCITQNEFVHTSKRSACIGHLQCPNDPCGDLLQNGGTPYNTEWVNITPTAFVVGKEPPKGFRV